MEWVFWDNPYDQDHALGIEVHDMDMEIPMAYSGTKLAFKTSTPTEYELNVLPRVILTSDSPWNPHNVQLGKVQSGKLTDVTYVRRMQVQSVGSNSNKHISMNIMVQS